MEPADLSLDPRRQTLIDTQIPSGSTALILGTSFTGKTTMLVNALYNILSEGSYDIVVIFTESINAEPLKALPNSHRIVISQGFYPQVMHLMHRINRETKNRYRFLCVLDDIIGLKGATLEKAVLIYRNSGISTIILIQDPKLVKPSMRSSFHNIYFTGDKAGDRQEYIIKNWLRGQIKKRLPEDTKPSRLMRDMEQWFVDNTRLDTTGPDGGRFIWLDNIHSVMTVQKRPKPRHE